MRIGHSFKKAVSFIVSIALMSENFLMAAPSHQPVQQDRTVEHIRELISGATPSDIPVAGVTQSARDERALLVENQNLAPHIGKNIFVGYGVYDIDEKNCKYIEKPGLTKVDYKNSFYKTSKFAQHDYGLSNSKMSYSSCKALATHLGGHIFVPDTVGERNFALSVFVNARKNGSRIGTIWTGVFRQSCSDREFYNETGEKQTYLPFRNDYEKYQCSESSRYTTLNETGIMEYSSPSQNRYCLVEFESQTMYRPIKICAPWWRIIRTYKKKPNTVPYNIRFLKTINQADIPANMSVCTKYDEEGISQIQDGGSARLVQCTTYYSRKRAPECVDKPYQDQCFVNECAGYVENACELKREKKVGKGYVKGEVVRNGHLVETKVHLDVKTREYLCPPSPVSSRHCLSWTNALIYPKECPGSQCAARKQCIEDLYTSHAGDYTSEQLDQAIDACSQNNPCIKIYADRSIPLSSSDIDPQTGAVLRLRGKCPDGTILTFEVNEQNTHKKMCIEYERKTVTKLVKQKCVLERPYEEKVVDMSLTEVDPYEDDPNCIREDDVRTSQPLVHINVEIQSKGYMRHKARIVNLDKTTETVIDSGSSDFTINMARYPFLWHQDPYFRFSYEDDTEVNYTVVNQDTTFSCGMFDPASTDELRQRTLKVFFNKVGDDYILDSHIDSITRYAPPYLQRDPNNLWVTLKDFGGDASISSMEECIDYPNTHGFSEWVIDYHWAYRPNGGSFFCTFKLKSLPQDPMIEKIHPVPTTSPAGFANKIKYVFNASLSIPGTDGQPQEDPCLVAAYCMDGTRENSGGECHITQGGEEAPPEYEEQLGLVPDSQEENFSIERINVNDVCKPGEQSFSSQADLDSIRSIMVFEDFLDGGFGYYSNYNTFPIQSNEVYINVDNERWKLPIEKMRTIQDRMHYHVFSDHGSYRKKKPNLGLLFLGGGVAGAAGYFAHSAWAAAIVGVVVVIIIILFTKPKKMDRQVSEHFIYKDIPSQFYSQGPYNRYEVRLTPAQDEAAATMQNIDGSSRTFNYRLNKEDNDIVMHPGYIRKIYFHYASDTGIDKPAATKKRMKSFLNHKFNILGCMGFSNSEINRFTHPDERDINYGYPKCGWLNPWCEKERHHFGEYTSNTSVNEEEVETTEEAPLANPNVVTDKKRAMKETGTVYLGADNSVMILVPFIGNYRVEAYNKYGDLLASRIIHESSFTQGEDSDGLLYAQVNFAINMNTVNVDPEGNSVDTPAEEKKMNLAPGIEPGLRDHACLQDRMVEWGGGVSGVFFESQRTDESHECQKSNDAYVYDQSATKLFVQPLNMEDGGFEFNLTKPLPFPNRVWIATLNMKQKRKYLCYKDFPLCGEGTYQNTGGGGQE